MTLLDTERTRGPVLRPGDDGYDAERAGFQTARAHRPAAIVGATGADDVRATVELAAAHDAPVGVQATGHGLSATADGGVLITTGRMDGVRVDASAGTAWLDAGVRFERAIEAAAAHGLAPLSGSAPDVGAVGYVLSGGIGLLARRYGYAADHVRRIDVVTADGRLRYVTADSDPDLFWALRGGQGNFGVVTGLEVDLVPVARVYGGGLYFDGELAADVLRVWAEWTAIAPDELSSSVALIPMPDLPMVPETLRGRYVAHVRIAYAGEAADGERLVAPLRDIGPRLIDRVEDMPYTASGAIYNDPTQPHAYDADNALLRDLEPAALDAVLDLAGPSAPVPCIVQIRHLGGALARPPVVPNALGHRNAEYLVSVISPLHGVELAAVRAAHGRLLDALAPWSTGGRSLNFLYGEHGPEAVRSAFDRKDYERLARLKATYDPTNMFRLNHNVPPA